MNRHFRDARYYARRTAEEAAAGVREELEPVEQRVQELRRDTDDGAPEPTRRERVRGRATRAERRTREGLRTVRQRI